jgi:Fe-Mn family superoxide dismutase
MYALPDLPYPYDALAPLLSRDTLHVHHDRHHRAYVEKTNTLAAEAGLAGRPLEEVIREAHRRAAKSLFNNAAQAWNHAFFWRCMRPAGGGEPSGELAEAIRAFGGQQALKDAFVEEGFGHFASGWVWIVTGSNGLEVISTHDAEDTLVREGVFPLLTCDLWEHAYYLDYKNDRKAFLERWFESLANWDFAAAQLAAANGAGDIFRYPPPQPDPDRDAELSETVRPSL